MELEHYEVRNSVRVLLFTWAQGLIGVMSARMTRGAVETGEKR